MMQNFETTNAKNAPIEDIYFAETALDVEEFFAGTPVQALNDAALLLFTPDSIVSEQVRDGANLLGQAGFEAVSAARVRLNRLSIREIWRHQLSVNRPSDGLDRAAVCDLLLCYSDCVALMLLDRRSDGSSTAASRLSTLKGSGDPALRASGTLRSVLYSPDCVFRLVHSPDGPTEMIRELGILFPREMRRRFLSGLKNGQLETAATIEALAAAALRSVGVKSLRTLEAVQKLIELIDNRLAQSPHDSGEQLKHLATLLERVKVRDSTIGARAIYAAIEAADLHLDGWELILLGARTLCREGRDD